MYVFVRIVLYLYLTYNDILKNQGFSVEVIMKGMKQITIEGDGKDKDGCKGGGIQSCECAAAHVALRTSTACEKDMGIIPGP